MLLAVFVVVSLPKCACDDTPTVLGTPALDLIDEQGTSHRAAEPWLSLDVGALEQDQTARRTLTIRNTGTGTLRLERACIVAAATLDEAVADRACLPANETPFSITDPAGTELTADEDHRLQVTFTPAHEGLVSYFLRVDSNAPEEPRAAVELRGSGWGGRLCPAEPSIDFGAVEVSDSATDTLELENCGLRPITIESWELATNPDGAFTAALNGPTPAPFTLAPGDKVSVDASFVPPDPAAYLGEVVLLTSSESLPSYRVRLIGDGVTGEGCRLRIPEVLDFGRIVSRWSTTTRELVIESVGTCACQVGYSSFPQDGSGFRVSFLNDLPAVLRGTEGCADDPEGAATAESSFGLKIDFRTDGEAGEPKTSELRIETTDPRSPHRVPVQANVGPAAGCELEVTPFPDPNPLGPATHWGIVDFGTVPLLGVKKEPIELRNVGQSLCRLSGVAFDENTAGNEFGLEREDGTPMPPGGYDITVAPGETARLYATFSPTRPSVEPYSAPPWQFGGCDPVGMPVACNGVELITNDAITVTLPTSAGAGRFLIGFNGTPGVPRVEIAPAAVDFGAVGVECASRERMVRVHSRGNGDATIGAPFVNGAAAPFFRVTTDQPTFPARLRPGQAAALSVQFFPTSEGAVTGEILIPLIAPDGSTTYRSVPVTGTGVAEPATNETFDQPANPPLDVLLVVDDSASMADDAARVRANVPSLLHPAALGDADFRIAVTTVLYYDEPTDYISRHWELWNEHPLVGHHTRCSWANRFVVPDSPDAATMLGCNAEVFLEEVQQVPFRPRPGIEAPFGAAWRFFSPENMSDPTRNGAFLRDEADLHVILIADEKDLGRLSLDLYYDFFRTLKQPGGAARVRVSAVAINEDTCLIPVSGVGDQPPTWEGTDEYLTIAQEMNGHFFPICEDDWTPFRNHLGADVLEQRKRFYLAREPDPATLSVCVRVNGAGDPTCVPQVQGESADYRYEAEGNMVVFSLAALPPPGARVEVSYDAACLGP